MFALEICNVDFPLQRHWYIDHFHPSRLLTILNLINPVLLLISNEIRTRKFHLAFKLSPVWSFRLPPAAFNSRWWFHHFETRRLEKTLNETSYSMGAPVYLDWRAKTKNSFSLVVVWIVGSRLRFRWDPRFITVRQDTKPLMEGFNLQMQFPYFLSFKSNTLLLIDL